jgi:tetratricopeptide (TPR) repeat protein
MMQKLDLSMGTNAHISTYRFPELSFSETNLPFESLKPIWASLNRGQTELARTMAIKALVERAKSSNEERAAIKSALAAAELRLGAIDSAKRQAGRALDLHPNQFIAHRVLLATLYRRRSFAAAYLHLLNLPLPKNTPVWDSPLELQEVEIALASWAWQLGEWDQVFDHISRAYPDGLDNMPSNIREDWFRLALYRGHPEDAAAAAVLMMEQATAETTDQLLQTIVGSGWTKQALPLYRAAFAARPESELLRRRLVGLCIREGQLDEARALAKCGALRTAA